MRVYRSVCTYIWNDDKFPFASDDCQLVWFHLFTHPSSTPLGLLRASIAGLAEDKNRNGGWTLARYTKAFEEALRHGFVKADRKALLISFPKYFSPTNTCNHPQSPNVVTSWGERFHDLPSSPLKTECYQSLKDLLKGFGEGFQKAFQKAFGEVCLNTDPYPESLSLTPEPEPEPKKKRVKTCEQPSALASGLPSSRVWERYREAYLRRYKTEPLRNLKSNSQIIHLIKRVGEAIAPDLAEFYVWHNDAYYVRSRHPPGLLLRDCEGLHTQWQTGQTVTQSQARKIDETQGRVNVFQELINERKGGIVDV